MYETRYNVERVGYEVFDAVTLAVSSQLWSTEAQAQRVCDRLNPDIENYPAACFDPGVSVGDFARDNKDPHDLRS